VSQEAPTSQTAQTSRSDSERHRRSKEWFLIRALDCDAPTRGSARHALRAIQTVEFERDTTVTQRRDTHDSHGTLRLTLDDRKLSAHHARLTRNGGVWVLEDLNSTNGSWVDGERITRASLHDGGVFILGHTVFLLRLADVERRVEDDVFVEPRNAPSLATLSPALEESAERLASVSVSQLPILLLGESGTGKEVAARTIHELSRRPGPFVPVNCGAIPPTLVEAQLFGHTKGSFTGAMRDEIGFVRSAAFGTLFLDEIGDLPAASQAPLLRVLQAGEVTPVGSARAVHVDVRIVAATHRDVKELMDSGVFRRDLYARLAGFVNALPPLRDRPEDLGLLIGALLLRHSPSDGDPIRLRPDAARALFTYAWPLNVRELEQCLAAGIAMAKSRVLGPEHLPDMVRDARRSTAVDETVLRTPEQRALHDTLVAALRESRGNIAGAARHMGKARQQVQRWVKRFGIDPKTFQ
jgi:transcriptional regulator with GAF, ATPase, and Fis domain